MVVETHGALTCRSSTLAVLADSGPFHGLLLTVLGSKSDFHDYRILACVYVSVINTRSVADSGPFLGLLFWVPEAISIVVEPQGALTCRSSTLAILADFGPFRGLLLTILGSWSDFHD